MPDKKPVTCDVGCNQSYQLEHYRGSDRVSKYALVDSKNSDRVAVFEKDQVLELTGDGTGVAINIPGNIGIEEDDPLPRIKLSTAHNEKILINGKYQKQESAAGIAPVEAPDQVTSKDAPLSQQEINTAMANNVMGFSNGVLAAVAEEQRKLPQEMRDLQMANADSTLKTRPTTPGGFVSSVLGPAIA